MQTFMSTLVGFIVIIGVALVCYAASKGEDHSVPVNRKGHGNQ